MDATTLCTTSYNVSARGRVTLLGYAGAIPCQMLCRAAPIP